MHSSVYVCSGERSSNPRTVRARCKQAVRRASDSIDMETSLSLKPHGDSLLKADNEVLIAEGWAC